METLRNTISDFFKELRTNKITQIIVIVFFAALVGDFFYSPWSPEWHSPFRYLFFGVSETLSMYFRLNENDNALYFFIVAAGLGIMTAMLNLIDLNSPITRFLISNSVSYVLCLITYFFMKLDLHLENIDLSHLGPLGFILGVIISVGAVLIAAWILGAAFPEIFHLTMYLLLFDIILVLQYIAPTAPKPILIPLQIIIALIGIFFIEFAIMAWVYDELLEDIPPILMVIVLIFEHWRFILVGLGIFILSLAWAEGLGIQEMIN